jgi:hypothetical protein
VNPEDYGINDKDSWDLPEYEIYEWEIYEWEDGVILDDEIPDWEDHKEDD